MAGGDLEGEQSGQPQEEALVQSALSTQEPRQLGLGLDISCGSLPLGRSTRVSPGHCCDSAHRDASSDATSQSSHSLFSSVTSPRCSTARGENPRTSPVSSLVGPAEARQDSTQQADLDRCGCGPSSPRSAASSPAAAVNFGDRHPQKKLHVSLTLSGTTASHHLVSTPAGLQSEAMSAGHMLSASAGDLPSDVDHHSSGVFSAMRGAERQCCAGLGSTEEQWSADEAGLGSSYNHAGGSRSSCTGSDSVTVPHPCSPAGYAGLGPPAVSDLAPSESQGSLGEESRRASPRTLLGHRLCSELIGGLAAGETTPMTGRSSASRQHHASAAEEVLRQPSQACMPLPSMPSTPSMPSRPSRPSRPSLPSSSSVTATGTQELVQQALRERALAALVAASGSARLHQALTTALEGVSVPVLELPPPLHASACFGLGPGHGMAATSARAGASEATLAPSSGRMWGVHSCADSTGSERVVCSVWGGQPELRPEGLALDAALEELGLDLNLDLDLSAQSTASSASGSSEGEAEPSIQVPLQMKAVGLCEARGRALCEVQVPHAGIALEAHQSMSGQEQAWPSWQKSHPVPVIAVGR